MKKQPAPAVAPTATRLPWPQTPESARTYITANGLTVTGLAKANNLPRLVLQDLLRRDGCLKGFRGKAHLAAIVLGLKPAPGTEAANDPQAMPQRKGAAPRRAMAMQQGAAA